MDIHVVRVTNRNMIYVPTAFLNKMGVSSGKKLSLHMEDKVMKVKKNIEKKGLDSVRGMFKLPKGQVFEPRKIVRMEDLPYERW